MSKESMSQENVRAVSQAICNDRGFMDILGGIVSTVANVTSAVAPLLNTRGVAPDEETLKQIVKEQTGQGQVDVVCKALCNDRGFMDILGGIVSTVASVTTAVAPLLNTRGATPNEEELKQIVKEKTSQGTAGSENINAVCKALCNDRGFMDILGGIVNTVASVTSAVAPLLNTRSVNEEELKQIVKEKTSRVN